MVMVYRRNTEDEKRSAEPGVGILQINSIKRYINVYVVIVLFVMQYSFLDLELH